MAKSQTNRPPVSKMNPPRLDENLVLFRFILHQFGVTRLEELVRLLPEYNHNDDDFIDVLRYRVSDNLLQERLIEYDRNIKRYTRDYINKGRGANPTKWKYFQYLSLIFTEIYLDWYFGDKKGLLDALKAFCQRLKDNGELTFDVSEYTEQDINKVAIWQATGSGKTLLMHMHILMVEHYLKKYKKRDRFNKYILITPNDRLSAQHIEELRLSNIDARIFNKDESERGVSLTVSVIEITKIAKEMGNKTIDVLAFGDDNIVLIDEAHRGSSVKKIDDNDERVWKDMRDKVYANGFAFEYSATFGQAIQSTVPDLFNEYSKTILFDYSYRYFYGDGYGKDFNVVNIRKDTTNVTNYLIASLLTFYQQMRVYLDLHTEKNPEIRNFNFERPLMMFVGAKVLQSDSKDISDVMEVIKILKRIIERREDTIYHIEDILAGGEESGLIGLAVHFDYIRHLGAIGIYEDMLKIVFNMSTHGKRLVVHDLAGVAGEIGLKVAGEANNYFGVINIGDKPKFLSECDKNQIETFKQPITDSLFQKINDRDSTVQILIGSKKFNEGWNSWRVSIMGLLKIGKSQGTQIIQLFGRGVRLRGYNNTLKRSSALLPDERPSSIHPDIEKLETLHIFGVQANYMEVFKDFLEQEGLSADFEEVLIPVTPILDELSPKPELQWITHNDDFVPFPNTGIELNTRDDVYVPNRPIELNLYSKLQGIQVGKAKLKMDDIDRSEHHLNEHHIQFIDRQYIFNELMRFKREQRDGMWANLKIDVDNLLGRLMQHNWYKIYAPQSLLKIGNEENPFDKVRMWEQDIVLPLLKKYLTSYYWSRREEYEQRHRIYRELTIGDGNFVQKHRVLVDKGEIDNLQIVLGEANQHLDKIINEFPRIGKFRLLIFSQHLYRPLVYINSKVNSIKVSPPPLNEGELTFMTDLCRYYTEYLERRDDLQIFLLRNQSRGHGLGFFEAGNFYPDFVLWVMKEGKQYINFIDPKGIRNLDRQMQNPKIQFHQTIKEIEMSMANPNIILNSFVVSVTPHEEIKGWAGAETLENCYNQHLLFMDDDKKIDKIFNAILR